MRLPVPGPTAVLGSAVAAAEAVEAALGLVPRAVEAMGRVEALLDRAEAMVERTEKVVATADDAAARTHKTLDTVEIVTRQAGRHSDAAAGMIERVDTSLSAWEPTLRRLAPAADRFATALEQHEVDAAIALVDRLPLVLDHLENDVLPMLKTLDRVGPDLHEVLEVVEDLRRVITGLPGVGLLRRRGDDEPPAVDSSVHEDGSKSRSRRS
jgi:hypothetical protein